MIILFLIKIFFLIYEQELFNVEMKFRINSMHVRINYN